MKAVYRALTALALMQLLATPVGADERDHRPGFERERHQPWHGDIHRFHERDLAIWRGGHWFQGRHDGRRGWWWIVGPTWYYYPAPVYPFPDPYQPPIAVLPPGQALPSYWYYCPNPVGYYPYVAACATGWQRVAANSASGPPPVVASPAPVMAPQPPPAPVTAPGAPQYWYYCQNPPGYYPTVERCNVNWQPVPAASPR